MDLTPASPRPVKESLPDFADKRPISAPEPEFQDNGCQAKSALWLLSVEEE